MILPTLEQLAASMALMKARGIQLWFTKLDVSNMFYTCKLPPDQRTAFRIRVGGDTYAFAGLPFGWSRSPALAQELLGCYLATLHPTQVVVIQYLDDILLFCASQTMLETETQRLVSILEPAGWVISPKSQTRPAASIQWVGKEIDGHQHTIASSAPSVSSLIVSWVRLATSQYRQKRMRQFLGKALWATRPGNSAMPFLAGAYAWSVWGPPMSKYTPPAVLRGMMAAVAIAARPWRPPPPLPPCTMIPGAQCMWMPPSPVVGMLLA